MEKKTPLYEAHVALGARMTPFGGYSLPVQYGAGIIKEHNAVRSAVGVFDVSHMGEFILEGPGALSAASRLVTNDLSRLMPGRARYSPMCNDSGGVVDDLLVYMLASDKLMLVVNASNRDKDRDWILARLGEGVSFRDASDETALVALQGRRAADVLTAIVEAGASHDAEIPRKPYTFTDGLIVAGKRALVSRTGYTGEDGFEFYVGWDDAPAVFSAILEAGRQHGILPCGLGARDTLRLEASMPLYGHEMDESVTPLEAGLGAFVKMEGRDFVGRKALASLGSPARKRVGLELVDKGIAREACPVLRDGERIGQTTSGTMSPLTGKSIAMALVDSAAEDAGNISLEVRGRRLAARFAPMPFYKRDY